MNHLFKIFICDVSIQPSQGGAGIISMNQISHTLRLQSELSSMTSRCQRVEEACRVAQKANHGGMDVFDSTCWVVTP